MSGTSTARTPRRFGQVLDEKRRNDPEAERAWEDSRRRRELAAALTEMRLHRGYSQRRLAELSGLHQAQIARLEAATGPWPDRRTLALYVAACGGLAGLVLGHRDGDTIHIDATIPLDRDSRDSALRDALADVTLPAGPAETES